MRETRIGETDPVTLDRCPRGHGIWFDRGEIKRVIQQFGGMPETSDARAVAEFFSDVFRNAE
jgi:Zn-finger nucleic acid-binding protein